MAYPGKLVVSIGSLLLFAAIVCVQGQNTLSLVSGPFSINVSYNGKATFECSCANADVVIWLLNNSHHETLMRLKTKQQTSVYQVGNWTLFGRLTLPIVGVAKYMNNTEVVCKCLSRLLPYALWSKPAKLLLQGTVASPSDVTAFFMIHENKIRLSWVPPYTLDGVAISGYSVSVTITNKDTYKEKKNFDTTRTQLILPTFDQSSCTQYNICVNAITAAGLGEKACVSENRQNGVPRSLTIQEVSVHLLESNLKQGTEDLIYEFKHDLCPGDRANSARVKLMRCNGERPCLSILDTFFNISGYGTNVTLSVPLNFCPSNVRVTSIIELNNCQGSVQSEIIPLNFPRHPPHTIKSITPILSPADTSSVLRPYVCTINTVMITCTFILILSTFG